MLSSQSWPYAGVTSSGKGVPGGRWFPRRSGAGEALDAEVVSGGDVVAANGS